MKKVIIILAVLACSLTLGSRVAFAENPHFSNPASWWVWVSPLSGQTDAYKFNFMGALGTDFYDDYGTPSGLDCNEDGTVNALDTYKDGLFRECGYWFEIVAKRGNLVKAGTTTFNVVDGVFYARWDKLFQFEAEDDVVFTVKLTIRDPLTKAKLATYESASVSICDIAGATSHIDACKPEVVEPPDPGPVDNCPSNPNKTEPGLCGCTRTDVDENNNGICDFDEPDLTQDSDNDGYSDGMELNSCGAPSDPNDPNDIPADADCDFICDVVDGNDSDGPCGSGTGNNQTDEEIYTVDDPAYSDLPNGDDSSLGGDFNLPDSDAGFSSGGCTLNPHVTTRTEWPLMLLLICLAAPIVVHWRMRKSR